MTNEFQEKQNLPNAVAVLVLGICSIVFSCAFVGLACGIIGLLLSSKGVKMYKSNPNIYSGYGMLNAGRITSIIGICLGGLTVIYYVVIVLILGLVTTSAVGFEGFKDFIDAADNLSMAF